jgi:HAE1 family hydrophobic/amphiphilic exporter-1
MTLSEICVRRPVFATMLVGACVSFGLLSFGKLGVDQFPDVDLPVVTVTTTLRGASPEEIENQVTQVIEDAVSTAEGIDELRSTSTEGISQVTVQFFLDRNRDQATQDVRDKVAAVLKRLPTGTDPPVVTRFDTTAIPVLTVAVSGDRELREVTEIAREQVLEPLQGVRGVGQIQIVGGRTRALNIFVNVDALIAQGIGIDQVRAAIQQQNVEVPAGRITREGREEVLRTLARIENVDDLRKLVIAERQGTPVTLADVARVEDAEEEPRSLSRLDSIPAVSLIVQKQAGTNTVAVVDELMTKIAALKSTLPSDVHIEILRDQSKFIRRSIHEVEVHLVLGGILASLAVLLFMGSFRSTIIAAIAIPSSIITTFAILNALDYTLNNFTLLALTLSVGIVIDDAIVVLENVHRHVEEGESPFDAAIKGTKEITLAVMATTLSLIVIFLPTAFMEGRVGRFWRGFGVTTAFAIGVSLFISLTLTPMLCSRLLKPKGEHQASSLGFVDKLNGFLDRTYGALVRWSLRHRLVVVAVAAVTIAAVVPLSGAVPKDFIPQDDTSDFAVSLVMPEGSDLSTSSTLTSEIEAKLKGVRGVERIFTTIGSTRGGDDVTEVSMYIQTVDIADRDYSLVQIMGEARKLVSPYAELRPQVAGINNFGSGRGSQFTFNLRGKELTELSRLTEDLMTRMREIPGIVDVDSSAAVRKPEIRVKVDRRRAADLGVRADGIASALRTMVGGEEVSTFRDGDEQYDVWLRLEAKDRRSSETIKRLPIASPSGLVRLDAIASLSEDRGPAQVERLNRIRQVEIGSNLDGLALGEAVERTKSLAATMNLPAGYELVFGGRAKLLAETFGNFLSALLLSFLFMYMILAAQFESFLHPVTIMLALPLSLPFALLSLLFMNDSLNIYSAFGMFMLFGIVKKNGILQVDYTNVLRGRGMDRDQAIVQANITRLRPILMTTLTLIAGMIPIALGKGPGAAARASMANVIIGGQAMSLLITLLIVPVAYAYFDDAGKGLGRLGTWWKSRRGA